jgi:DNA-binding ferritin-like protein
MANPFDSEINLLLTGDANDSRGIFYFKTVIQPNTPTAPAAPVSKLTIDTQPLLQFIALNKYYADYKGTDPDNINPVFVDFILKVIETKAAMATQPFNAANFPTLIPGGAVVLGAAMSLLQPGGTQIGNAGTPIGWINNVDNWFPDVPMAMARRAATSFNIDPVKFLNDLKKFHFNMNDDAHDYFPLTQALNATFKAQAQPTNLVAEEVNMIAQCVTNGDATKCHQYLDSLTAGGATEASLQAAVNKISPKILIGALDTLGFKIKTLNGLTAIQDYHSWVKRAGARGVPPATIAVLQNQSSLLAKLINMMVTRARSETLLETDQQPTYAGPTPTATVQYGLTGFYPMTHYQITQKHMSPAEELKSARKMIRDLQAAAGLHKLRNVDGFVMQFGGEPEYQSGGAGTDVYKNLFESLYRQVKAATGREVDDKTRGIISDAITNLEKYDTELRRFLKDLGIVSVVSNIFTNTPQGPITQGMLHAAVTKYKACLSKYAIRQGNILGVADQLCSGAV